MKKGFSKLFISLALLTVFTATLTLEVNTDKSIDKGNLGTAIEYKMMSGGSGGGLGTW